MEKIKVQICVGTTCFILGASELQDLERFLPAELQDKVDVCGTTCLGMCKEDNYGQAPFVRVGNRIVSNASISSVIAQIEEQLKQR